MSLAVVLLTATALRGQQPATAPPAQQRVPPTFASGTQVVQVGIRVLDKDGHFVPDLTAGDVEIKEDGVAQRIVSMTLVTAAASPQPVSSSRLPASGFQLPVSSGRASAPPIWVFVFDTFHLTPGALRNTRLAVVEFLRGKFHDGDVGGVIANGKMANNRLTSNRDELVKAAEDVTIAGNTQSTLTQLREFPRIEDESEASAINNDRSDTNPALVRAVQRACSERPDYCLTPGELEIARRDLLAKAAEVTKTVRETANLTLTVISGLSNGLARMPGPKTVVFLSEGFILQDMERELEEAEGMANRAGAHLYTIDARGLNRGTSSSNTLSQMTSFDSFGPSNHYDMQADGINALAVDTGGMAIRNENNFGRALDQIQQDAAMYYVIGYTPANQTFDGKYRKIETSVKRPGMTVRARRGYLAIEPAILLKPIPITTAPPAGPPAESKATTGAEVPREAIAPAVAPVPEPPAAHTLRSAIETRGLVQELQGAERLGPTKAGDLAGKGWAAYQKGDVEHAAVYLGEAAGSPEAHPWVRYALGLSHLALGRYPDAVAAWEQVRREVPEFEPVYFNLADGYLLQKNNDAALKVLRDAQERWPKDSEVWNATGVLEIRRGAIDAAVRSFTRAIAVEPDDSLGFFNLARAHQMRAAQSQRFDSVMQKWVGGEADARKAIEYYTKYVQMGGPFVQQAKEALQVLTWK